jgi:putative nucleotidyltransferase with HDIG domain
MEQILVIDDEPVICELLEDVLGELKYEVTTTLSGQDGIAKASEGQYDLIILDLKLPKMSGIEVLETIKKSDPDTVIIIVTGHPTFESVQNALKLGAYNYLTKPFNLDEICFVVKRGLAYNNLLKTNKQLLVDLENKNKELDLKVQERTRELVMLYDIANEISASLNLEETLNTITNKVAEVLRLEVCSILLFDEKNQYLTIVASKGLNPDIIQETRVKKGSRISGWVLEHEEALFVPDIESDERFRARNNERYYTRSFISVPLIVKDTAIGVININNKHTKEPLTNDDFRLIKGIAKEAAIVIANARLFSDLKKTYMDTVISLTSAIDAKDHYTHWHSQQVMNFATAIAHEMGLSELEIDNIKQACLLHDIGKIAVQDNVLTKPGNLLPAEWEEMKSHVNKSVDILRPLGFLKEVLRLIEQHHERYDGKGYPNQLKEDQILLGARIMTVADSFSAMVSKRPYRDALPREIALEELLKNKGTQFDPQVVDVFIKILEKDDVQFPEQNT